MWHYGVYPDFPPCTHIAPVFTRFGLASGPHDQIVVEVDSAMTYMMPSKVLKDTSTKNKH